jgi:hypothetical protein
MGDPKNIFLGPPNIATRQSTGLSNVNMPRRLSRTVSNNVFPSINVGDIGSSTNVTQSYFTRPANTVNNNRRSANLSANTLNNIRRRSANLYYQTRAKKPSRGGRRLHRQTRKRVHRRRL